MAEEEVRKILVINVSRIGDTLLVTPAIRAIAAAFPHANITCLGHPKRIEILRHLPFLHRVGAITKYRAAVMGRVLRKRYDLCFVYGYDRALVSYAIRVAHRVIAFRQDDDSINRRLYRAVPRPAFQSMHSVLLNLLLPNALDIPPRGYALAYRVTEPESLWAKAALRERAVNAQFVIGLQVASFPTKGYRDWPIEHFIALCERILAHHPRAHFLIFGGALERHRTEQLYRRIAANASLYAGKLSLRQTAALMSQLDLYVGIDTGPTHIMGTMGTPLVVLYHCYAPSRLIAPLEHPCLYAIDHPRLGADCTPETSMAEISVETVWDQVQAALARGRAGAKVVCEPQTQ